LPIAFVVAWFQHSTSKKRGQTRCLVWAGNYGASEEPLSGDGNLDNVVDGLDYLVWAAHYGDDPTLDPPGAGA
jgi:hypothetical protein